ncbi:MAG: inositol monophosphatase [Chloroflexi bacterium]|nr:inositol monophosphatase [Chloroflexota bacterium]
MLNDETLAREIEAAATELAQGAGDLLAGYFGRQLSIEYKDKHEQDPVTEADKASQEYLVREITRRYPGHAILGEEDSDESETPCADFLWVLDPLDGTTNFLNGLPVYAVSIGVLYQGTPLAGALFIPWPKPGGGFVLHCRRGGGCFAGEEPVAVYQSDEPVNNRLIGLPGHFALNTRFGKGMKGKSGEPRTMGSIAYELAMTACGSMQYAVFGAPRMWDMAAGVLAVAEAGGTVMTRLPGEKKWHPLDSLVPTWPEKPPNMKQLRRWVAPLVAGNRQVAPLVANNLRPRFRLVTKVRGWTRRVTQRVKKIWSKPAAET